MGCCLAVVALAGAPRLAFLLWWLFDSGRIMDTYGSFILPLLGVIFVPWTTIMYVLVFPGGINWFDWLWLGLALLVDIASDGGGEYSRRHRTA